MSGLGHSTVSDRRQGKMGRRDLGWRLGCIYTYESRQKFRVVTASDQIDEVL